MKVRKLLKKDIERYAQMCCYCFHMKDDDARKYIETGVEFGRGLIVEENQQIMSAMFYYPFVQNIRFQKMKMAGLSGVVTMPEARDRGFVREQLKIIQKDMREQGFLVSCLGPFKTTYYQKYGWCNGSRRLSCKIAIDDYLEFCVERGEQPDKPFSGKFILRIPPSLHHRIYLRATEVGKSINNYVEELLKRAV